MALEEFHRRIPDYELDPTTELKYSGVARSPEVLRLNWK